MSVDDHLRVFVEESRESIDTINGGLLTLEAEPDDDEAMDAVFRAAHTVKGNAAAMGFDEASSLAHAVEDLLDEVREGEVSLTADRVDLLFEGVDALEGLVDEIGEHGETRTDTSDLRERLRAIIDDEVGSEATDAESDRTDRADADVSADAPDAPLVRATIAVGEDMPGVDAVFVLQALEDAFESVHTDPDRGAIEEGEFGESFDIYVPGSDPEAVTGGVESLSKVESVDAALVGDGRGDGAAEGETTGEAVAEAVEESDRGGATHDGREEDESDDPQFGGDADSSGRRDGDGDESDGAGERGRDESDSDDAGGRDDGVSDADEINSIRVDVDQLDELYGLVEQLVTSRIRLRKQLESAGVEDTEAIDQLDKLSESLQNTVMDMRLVPLERVIRTFPRLVRDTARDLDKEVGYETEGAEVELDRTILTEMRDPLVHIIRNSLDHGIEPPDERERKGKPRRGTIRLAATRERDHVTITVADDGAGLDPDAIAERAVERGVVGADDREAMTDSEIFDLIFEPGFSTTEEVTDVSGRGVGMDVVQSTVERLDGSVSVDSTPGEGTTVTLRLPVTMAIVKTMFVRAGEEIYGVPVKNVDEVSSDDAVEWVHGDPVVRHDDSLYPVVDLDEALDVPDAGDLAVADGGESGGGMLLRIREEERAVALACDRVVEQEEVVVKPLEGVLSGTPGLGGTAVLGDGEIIPILDVTTL